MQAALTAALELSEGGWLELGEATGHYLTEGSAPHSETISAVIAHLEAMRPADITDPFALPTGA